MLETDMAIEAIQGALDRERAANNPSEIIGMSYQFAEALIEMLKAQKRLVKFGGMFIVSDKADEQEVMKKLKEAAVEKLTEAGVLRIDKGEWEPDNLVAWSIWAVRKE